MKFAAQDQRYLAERGRMSAAMGPRELWSSVDHWPLYVGISNLARNLAIVDLFRSTQTVPGDLAEFGTWRGSTLMLLAKLLHIHDPHGPKVVHGFDTFEGLNAFTQADGAAADSRGLYAGDLEELRSLVELYDMIDAIELHEGLIEETLPELLSRRPELMFSFVYCDTDLYASTATVLDLVAPRVMPNGLLVFDEWNFADWPGEGTAVNEYLATHAEDFAIEAPQRTRQPSLVLRKRG